MKRKRMNEKKKTRKNDTYGSVSDVDDLATVEDDSILLPEGLTDRQKQIIRMKRMGLTQKAMGTMLKISQPMVNKELKKIREIFTEQGANISQALIVGDTVDLFGEIEKRGWELYTANKDKKPSVANRALETIMAAREKTLKLMMELGIMKKAPTEHEHTLKAPPFLKQLEQATKQQREEIVIDVISSSHLDDLEEPVPPQLEADNGPTDNQND